jgi:hypothetical protein
LLIGGEEVPASSGKRTTDLDPYTGKVMATVAGSSCGRRTRWPPVPQKWRRL